MHGSGGVHGCVHGWEGCVWLGCVHGRGWGRARLKGCIFIILSIKLTLTQLYCFFLFWCTSNVNKGKRVSRKWQKCTFEFHKTLKLSGPSVSFWSYAKCLTLLVWFCITTSAKFGPKNQGFPCQNQGFTPDLETNSFWIYLLFENNVLQ